MEGREGTPLEHFFKCVNFELNRTGGFCVTDPACRTKSPGPVELKYGLCDWMDDWIGGLGGFSGRSGTTQQDRWLLFSIKLDTGTHFDTRG